MFTKIQKESGENENQQGDFRSRLLKVKNKLSQTKLSQAIFQRGVTVFCCVCIIVFGITLLSKADPITTSIGQDISTNNLSLSGSVTSGTWAGSSIDVAHGGTGQDWSAATQGSLPFFSGTGALSALTPGTAGQFLQSGGVGTNPSWTNVARTATIVVAASNSSVVSKKQADYVCDGTDDQVEIQAAINALPSEGGELKLAEGIFTISAAIVVNRHADIIGSGVLNTDIRLANGANSRMIEYNLPNTVSNIQLIKLEDLRLYGNKENQSSGSEAINTFVGAQPVKDYMLQNVWIESYRGNGITINGTHNWLLLHTAIERVEGAGVNLFWSGDGSIFASLLFNNWHGITTSGTLGEVRIISNRIDLSSYEGIEINSSGVVKISDNTITSSSNYEAGHSGIYLNSVNSSVIGNYISGNAQKYGIEEIGTSDSNIISLNTIGSYATGGIKQVGASTLVQRNMGYKTENSGTSTITAGQTSVTVTHSLAATPTRVQLTPTTNTAGKSYWISAKTATTFTITIDSTHTSDITFDWRGVVGEGN